MSTTAEISIVLRWEMFVAKYSLPGKVTSTQPNYNDKFTLELQKNHSKIDSTTKQNPLPMKIIQMTELSKEYWDIKRKRACYLCLNEKLEINHIKETT